MQKRPWLAIGWRSRCAALLLALASLTCNSQSQATIEVRVVGLTDSVKTIRVENTLDGQPERGQPSVFGDDLDRFEVVLAPNLTGSLGISVYAQDQVDCDILSGTSTVEITGNERYRTTVSVDKTTGCVVQVRKLGEGGGEVLLSDGTSWQFLRPNPTQAVCPVPASPSEEQHKTATRGSVFTIRPMVSSDVGRGSFVSTLSGCRMGGTECELEVTSATATVEVTFSALDACSGSGFCWDHPRPQGQTLYRVAGTHQSLWVVGESAILTRTGTLFTTPRTPPMPTNLRGLAVINDSTVVAVGDRGAILRRDEKEWKCVETVTSADLQDVWGSSVSDIWAVGGSGAIFHFDGTTWQAVAVAGLAGIGLRSVSGNSATNVWAVGEKGTVLH